ncbi:acetylcholinesterase [Euwallacea fornicatus]|uniref:acetylcholinesterase n=1 Tax=Euwallacea fornicatus TaxID=995702 RepID=UPI0033904E41
MAFSGSNNVFLAQLRCLYLFTVFWESLTQHVLEIPNQGKIKGVELSKVRIQKIIAYYGIPYAQPPIGNLRFVPPRTDPLPSWSDVRNETDYQPACLQVKEDYKESELPFLQLLTDIQLPGNTSEDCLYLNVFVPNVSPPAQGFATIIWIHPGNFTTGMPSIWNPHTLVYRQKVIVVTFSWRLNVMGFFTTMDGEAAGNYGLMDQQAAMQWVKKNIQLFGGDPNNISLMGYGTGAISVGIHMVNSESQTLFNKAILMSGSLFQPSAIKYPDEDKSIIDRLVKEFGCDRQPTSSIITCLRRAESNVLVQYSSNFNWRPVIDKDLTNDSMPFLSEPPMNLFIRGEFSKIPILTGYTNMEQGLEFRDLINTTSFTQNAMQQLLGDLVSVDLPNINSSESTCYNYEHVVDTVMFFYAPSTTSFDEDTFRTIAANFLVEKTYASSTILLASYMSEEQKTFVYRFDVKPSSKIANKYLPAWVKVPHLFDLTYVWGLPYWKPDQQEWDPWDKRIADTVMSFWTNFAKSSDPTLNTVYHTKWEPYTKDKPGLLIVDNNIVMSNPQSVNYKAFEFWNDYYPKVLSIAMECCGQSDSNVFELFSFLLHLIIGIHLVLLF